MKDSKSIPTSNFTDPVLDAMDRLANLISNDRGITKKERTDLIIRLEAERHAHTPHSSLSTYVNTPVANISAISEGEIPTIQIMADFCGYTHLTFYPSDEKSVTGITHNPGFLSPELTKELLTWQEEFESSAWNDYREDRTRSMQWVSFDYAGLQIAKRIKQHVQGRARVIYVKAIQNPFNRYDDYLEVHSDGKIVCLDDAR